MQTKNFLIFGLNYIGDVLMLTPAIRALKLKFPDANIYVLVSETAAPLLYRNPDVFKVIERKKHKGIINIIYLYKLYKELKKYNFYACINFLASFEFAFLSFFISKKRIGISNSKTFLFYNYKIKNDRKIHNIDRALKFIEVFSITEKYNSRQLIYIPSEEDIKTAINLLKDSNVHKANIVIFSPGSTRSSKEANPELFSLFAEYLNKLGYYVIITGSKKDIPLADKIYRLISDKKLTVNLTGITNIYMLGGLIKISKLVVAVDNGVMHLASAINTPLIALFGSTDPAICGPVNDSSYVIDKKTDCYHCFLNTCDKESFLKNDYPDCMGNIELYDLTDAMKSLKI
jgi:heptosyltransferase-2